MYADLRNATAKKSKEKEDRKDMYIYNKLNRRLKSEKEKAEEHIYRYIVI